MRILVLSDSHAGKSFMRLAIQLVRPHAVVHLGDYYRDAEDMMEENPHIPFYCVPGNCDLHRSFDPGPEIRIEKVCGVLLYMTHGHRHNVKLTRHRLIADAMASGAQAALYGHTHEPDCYPEGDMWVLNPGTCGIYGGTVGLIEVGDGQILSCQVLDQSELEEL